jgi:predicted alpha-1,2-mannosidase
MTAHRVWGVGVLAILAAVACGDSGQQGGGDNGGSGGGSGGSSGASSGSSGASSGGGSGGSGSGSSGGSSGAGSGGTSGSTSGGSSGGSSGGGSGSSSGGTSGSSGGGPDGGAPSLTPLVNPFIGTSEGTSPGLGFGYNSGDTFPGAAYPLGMVYFSPDTSKTLAGAYYYKDTTIKGISLTHFSGRGCSAEGDFPILPFVGAVTASPATSAATYTSPFSHSNELAAPGYYKVLLDGPDVTVELTATAHTGLARLTYPSSTSSTLLFNASGSVNGVTASSIAIDSAAGEVSGSAKSVVGCGSNAYTIYFAAKFDAPIKSYGTWNGATVSASSTTSSGTQAGAFVAFDTTTNRTVNARIGVSYVSIANARANLDAENPGTDFDTVRAAADAAWNARLASVLVQGGTHDQQVIFYTALYHAFFHPNLFSDANGQYLGFDGMVHTAPAGHAQYQNIPGWDHYRAASQLRAILAPAETSDVAQSLVNDAQQGDGHVPRWEQQSADSHGMNGDGGSTMIANSYAFGATAFDTAAAFAAMDGGQAKIREGLTDYTTLGYVANATAGNSAAITLEYSSVDFAIAQFAAAIGNTAKAAAYGKRAQNWANLFNAASGYIQPKDSSGSWTAGFSAISQTAFQEGCSAQYTWEVPFNLAGLFAKMGGNAAVVKRLDTFFTKLNDGPGSQYAFIGNEPSFEVPWEYAFAGAPAKTQSTLRNIQLQEFNTGTGGLPGNDDGGAMSSWYVFSALGIYPQLPGVGGFVIGSPAFTSATLRLGNGKTLQIHAPAAADDAPYVQGLKVNGAATTSVWLPWGTVSAGATLDFDLGTTAGSWGTGPNDAPPSFAQ